MTTSDHQPRSISLRALARELGVHHASLSSAVRDGRLTRGVHFDDHGRLVVIDADAAAANWRLVHSPRLAIHRAIPASSAMPAELYDRVLDRYVTPAELFAERNHLSVLVTAMAAEALVAGLPTAAFVDRVRRRLHTVAELHGASDDVLAGALAELESALVLLRGAEDDEDDYDDEDEP